MTYTIRPGDSLAIIALRLLGDAGRWPEIARLERVERPRHHPGGPGAPYPATHAAGARHPPAPRAATAVAASRHPNQPGAGAFPPLHPRRRGQSAATQGGATGDRQRSHGRGRVRADRARGQGVPQPDLLGLPPQRAADISRYRRRHVQGHGNSPFLSASRAWPTGARRFAGVPFWIDEAQARAAGATFHETDEIVAGLHDILRRTKDPASRAKLEELIEN